MYVILCLQAEKNQEQCCKKFEKISEVAKKEIGEFKTRRIAYFKKHMTELVELELKHARVSQLVLQKK